MTLFQSLFYVLAVCFGELLPIGPWGPKFFISQLTEWALPPDLLIGGIYFGMAFTATLHFRHDLLSQLSSVIKLILWRKKPQALDEKLPLFLALTVLPYWLIKPILPPHLLEAYWIGLPTKEWAGLIIFGFLFWFWDGYSRKDRGMFAWNLLDTLFFSLGYAFGQLLGLGALSSVLLFCLMRNYQREAALKYALLSTLPGLWLLARDHLQGLTFEGPLPQASQLTWLTLGVSTVASILISFLCLGTLERTGGRTLRSFAAVQILLSLLITLLVAAKHLHWI